MKVTKEKLANVVLKNNGNYAKSAKEIGITEQAVSKRILLNPDLKKKILTAREKAMQQAGITRSRVYRKIKEGLDANVVVVSGGTAIETQAPDYKERREHSKICLELYRDLDPENNQEKEKTNIEPHLHLHFDKLSPAELTNFLLGRFNGPV